MTVVNGMATTTALKEARLILQARSRGTVLWKTRIRHEWQTNLKRPALVELLTTGDLRVTDTKTGELIASGPAWPVYP